MFSSIQGRAAARSLPLRAAVVGSGAISKEHLSYLAGRSDAGEDVAERIRLVAVCDLSAAAATYGASQFGADTAYTDITAMLAQERLDVVHILTPPSTHLPLAELSLEAGAHVICEKPITGSTADLETLLAVADRCDRSIMESHNYRFNDGYLAIQDLVTSGRLGQVSDIEIRIALPITDPAGRFGDPNLPSPIHHMPAGVLHDFTTHFSYLLLGLTSDVKFHRISAAWSNHSTNPMFRFDDLDALLIGDGPEGPVHARLRFDSRSGPDTFSVTVRGTNGWAQTDFFQPFMWMVVPRPGGAQLSPIINHVANGFGLVRDGVANFGRKLLQHTPYHGLHRMLDHTYQALAAGRPLPVSRDDMLQTSRLVDRLLAEEVRL
ncbi:MAG: Gfo/Idh/MocA family oxidoreductase [Acidimicrobiia bacterium]|nr:Gfo/Idh/MocA family oxidoreductase [Acidimicrobiia bacterium]